uniref:Uncharacterized protein n=1 Tax=Trichobilharzia regenti TaxID=157069 RepID=A0AA85K4B5_TRIRE|nr:unnamed protein product [Trichobilharzia regenti]
MLLKMGFVTSVKHIEALIDLKFIMEDLNLVFMLNTTDFRLMKICLVSPVLYLKTSLVTSLSWVEMMLSA